MEMERGYADIVYIFVSPEEPGIMFYDRSPEPGSQLAMIAGTMKDGEYLTHPTDISEVEWDPSMNEENKTYLVRRRDGNVKVTTIMVSPEQMQKIRTDIARGREQSEIVIDTGRAKQNALSKDFLIDDSDMNKIEEAIVNQNVDLPFGSTDNSVAEVPSDDIPVIDIAELGIELPKFDVRGDEPDYIEPSAMTSDSNSNVSNGLNVYEDENLLIFDDKKTYDSISNLTTDLNGSNNFNDNKKNTGHIDFKETESNVVNPVPTSPLPTDDNFQAFLTAKDEALRSVMSSVDNKGTNLNVPSDIDDSNIDFKDSSGKGLN